MWAKKQKRNMGGKGEKDKRKEGLRWREKEKKIAA